MLAMGQQANAQTVSDYKALVCVFLYGGNDTYNTVLATDTASWAAYTAVRNQQPSPLNLMAPGTAADASLSMTDPKAWGGVLPLSPVTAIAGRSLALHPMLGRLQTAFNTDRRLAIVANVGTLTQPLTKDQYNALASKGTTSANGVSMPRKLFSHNDQQNTWQAFAPEGATVGWGGQLVDAFKGSNANAYASISLGGNAVWLSGKDVRQYQIGTSGPVVMGGSSTSVYGSTAVSNALRRIASNGLSGTGATGKARASHVLMADLGVVGQHSIDAEAAMLSAFNSTQPASDSRIGPASRAQYNSIYGGAAQNNPLALQLQAVARVIASRASLGAGRQVFFVQMSGFDTHDNQNVNHAELMIKLNQALGYFDDTLGLLGVQNKVTTFTASDFGRTFTSNGDGTDHGWGAHHFVMGGAVDGGKVFGSFPTLAAKNTADNNFDGSTDQLLNGVLLPKISVDQYGATLASWFGVSDLDAVFPNLKNFSSRNLGFMKA